MQRKREELLFGFKEIEELYQNGDKSAVIWGAGGTGMLIYSTIDPEQCKVDYFCDNDERQWGKFFCERRVISPNELREHLNRNCSCMVIIASGAILEIQEQLIGEMNVAPDRIIVASQYIATAYESKYRKEYLSNRRQFAATWRKQYALAIDRERLMKEFTSEVLVFAVPKVGNMTLSHAINSGWHTFHAMTGFGLSEEEKQRCRDGVRKLIIGVRDAVAQNISLVFEQSEYSCLVLGPEGRDAQKSFSYFIEDSICNEEKRRKDGTYGWEEFRGMPDLMQTWFDDVLVKDFGIDIYEFEFDKEKGYSIYNNVNGKDIFVYQLENLNILENVLGQFVGREDFRLSRENEASEKWYGDAYLNFKMGVTMSKEYLDRTYTGKMMQHFYSPEDIQKFRDRWNIHIG